MEKFIKSLSLKHQKQSSGNVSLLHIYQDVGNPHVYQDLGHLQPLPLPYRERETERERKHEPCCC